MKKILSIIISAALLLCVLTISVGAADRSVKVSIDGVTLTNAVGARLVGDTTYVPIYKFCTMLGTTSKSFDDATKTAKLTCRGINVYAQKGEGYIIANGRYIFTDRKNIIIDGTMLVPVRSIAKAFGAQVGWNSSDYSVTVSDSGNTIQSGDSFYNSTDLLWLSRIIYAESNTEPFAGKIAVGNVVLNRVRSNEFPNSVYGVIFGREYGVQFTPVENGAVYNTPSESCVIAAKICLEGFTYSDSVLYFMDAAVASNMWIANNRRFAFAIGDHSFYY